MNLEVNVISATKAEDEDADSIEASKAGFILRAASILRRRKPDIVHAHSHWHMLASALAYSRVNPGVRTVFTFHTEPVERITGTKKRIFEWMLSKCDSVTFVSESLRKEITSGLEVSCRKHVVYGGVKTAPVGREKTESFKSMHNLRDASPVISYVGNLVWKEKVEGVKRLVHAIKRVSGEYPKVRLLVVGDGAFRVDLERLVKNEELTDTVIFTGQLDDPSVAIASSDIYAHISLQEGMPLSILEAMSLARPIVASNVGGIPEVVQDGMSGVLVDTEPESIAKAIIDMYKDPKRMKALGAKAEQMALEKFNWERCASEFVNIYRGDV